MRADPVPPAPVPGPGLHPAARSRRASSLSRGQPSSWLSSGALVTLLAAILGLLGLILWRGFTAFWPTEVVEVRLVDGRTLLGQTSRSESYAPAAWQIQALPAAVREATRAKLRLNGGRTRRRRLFEGGFEARATPFCWVSDFEVVEERRPTWAAVVERQRGRPVLGFPAAFLVGDRVVARGPQATWERYEALHDTLRGRWQERRDRREDEIGALDRRLSDAAHAVRRAELATGRSAREVRRLLEKARSASDSSATARVVREYGSLARAVERWLDVREDVQHQTARIEGELDALARADGAYRLRLVTASGETHDLPVEGIVRATLPNRLSWTARLGVALARWGSFLTAAPREPAGEGGVWPALFGTVVMTLLMTVLVVPFGVLTALYLHEVARPGPVVHLVRIAVNNLAGVPGIVYGVFGLGFFCAVVGARIDALLYPEYAPSPVFGQGGLLWASATLALLTLPVVIVATEEALVAVPSSLRRGSYACGASRWQTIRRIVLPRALPGILTGAILAIARGAGEVAPLMLVGAVRLAPELPVDGVFPYLHLHRSFMHLGLHLYDMESKTTALPVVFSTALLLIVIVLLLNATGMILRARLRRRVEAPS